MYSSIKKQTIDRLISKELSEMWNVLTPVQKQIVSENFSIEHFKRNQLIYSEKDEPKHLWVLLRGKVKMFKTGAGDRPQIIRLYRPVQYFGYRAYFAGEPYQTSGSAFEESVIGCIPMEIIEELIKSNIDLAMFFIHDLCRNLGGSDKKIVNLTQKHIRGRLAESLLMLKENYGCEDDGITLKIYMSRDDLANLSNMTTSNAIRTLTAFVSEKLLLVDGRRISIINEEELRNISHYG